MAWNPSPEVAAVRDAANNLKSPFAVLVYLDERGEHLCTASYGKTKEICGHAGKLAKHLMASARTWGSDEPASDQLDQYTAQNGERE